MSICSDQPLLKKGVLNASEVGSKFSQSEVETHQSDDPGDVSSFVSEEDPLEPIVKESYGWFFSWITPLIDYKHNLSIEILGKLGA